MSMKSQIRIFHLLGGQVVIGECPYMTTQVIHPYEVFSAPNASTLKSTIALIPFGSLNGVLPSLTPEVLTLDKLQIVASILPPQELQQAYAEARSRSAEERARIQEKYAKPLETALEGTA